MSKQTPTVISAIVALSLAALASNAQDDRPRDAMADSLIDLWIDSVGGMETYHAFRSAQYTVSTYIFDTLSGRLKRTRPRYVSIMKGPYGEESRVERWEGNDFIEQGFNGRDAAWAAMNGDMLPDSAKDAREALYVSRDLFYWLGLPFKLHDPGVNLSYIGLIERPGASWSREQEMERRSPDGRYHAVGVSFGVGVGEHQDVFTYYFAPGKGFPFEVTYVEEGRVNLNRMLWGPTERAGDIRYPYVARRDWITVSGKRTKALLIYDVVLNQEIPQARFDRP